MTFTVVLTNSIAGAGMFFVGFGIGLMMNMGFQALEDQYDDDQAKQMLIGITQLIMISFIIYYFQSSVNTLGLFITGILMAQELFIMRMLPRRQKKDDKQKAEQRHLN